MRAGWVEVITDGTGTRFQASSAGRVESSKDVLTPVVQRLQRNLRFAIDRVSNSLIGLENVALRHARDSVKLRKQCITLRPAKGSDVPFGYIELVDQLSAIPRLLRADEKIVGCDPARSGFDSDWYLSLAVTGDSIEGLPPTSSSRLIEGIKAAVARAPKDQRAQSVAVAIATDKAFTFKTHCVDFLDSDLIAGGPAHLASLTAVVSAARQRVIVHSTFLAKSALSRHIPLFASAAKRGVRIDLLWDHGGEPEARRTFEECEAILERAGIQDAVKLWAIPTRSHAKQIFADDGQGGYRAIIGSCNWLLSPFKSFEVSVQLRSGPVIADCLKFLERTLPIDTNAEELREELISLALKLQDFPPLTGAAKVRLLSQGDHETIIAECRDRAKKVVFVASNKAGNAVETQIIAPFDSAATSRPLKVALFYQNENKGSALTRDVLDHLKRNYRRVLIDTVERAHAKLLCWDTDHAVVTSMNWMSKDASQANSTGECGVYLQTTGIADLVSSSYLSQVTIKKRK
jgi:hypothetical protein